MRQRHLAMVPRERGRLRVVTAGDVGNLETRLGSSGFDVVAEVDTEEDLVVVARFGDPDAIVVDADLCTSLERVHEVAPDAALIAVGDHTPAGALGHIDRGVTGTVLAGLLHALAGGGVSAAVAVPGFILAPAPPPILRAPRPVGRMLAASVVAVSIAVAVAVAATMGGSAPEERRATGILPEPVPEATLPPPSPAPVTPPDGSSPDGRVAREGPSQDEPGAQTRDDAASPAPERPRPDRDRLPRPAATESTHPPGHAYGWEQHKPPKHDDKGLHRGWTKHEKGPGS